MQWLQLLTKAPQVPKHRAQLPACPRTRPNSPQRSPTLKPSFPHSAQPRRAQLCPAAAYCLPQRPAPAKARSPGRGQAALRPNFSPRLCRPGPEHGARLPACPRPGSRSPAQTQGPAFPAHRARF